MYRAKAGGKAAYDIFYPGMPASPEAPARAAPRATITPKPTRALGV